MYKIYHIPGKKVGCSIEPETRVRAQGYDNYEILEEHTCVHEASKREKELQKQYGYKVDCIPYSKSIQIATTESSSKGGKIGGKISRGGGSIESGRIVGKLYGGWNKKLTFEEAEEIRYQWAKGNKTMRLLAEEYNVKKGAIFNIIHYKSYKSDESKTK